MKDIKIIHEDKNFWVLDKPWGITVNKSDTTKGEDTVQDWVLEKFKAQDKDFSKESKEFIERAGIVHRIDKETSGILLVAKNTEAFENLQRQFKERIVKKIYLALVHGSIEQDEGEIVVPVGRLPWDRKRFGVLAGGRASETAYKVLERLKKPYTLLLLAPKTGRTHQIRVHLKYFNHPIFADFLYAGRKTARNDRKILPRVFLHASKISFYDPASQKLLEFESPLPYELKSALELLNN